MKGDLNARTGVLPDYNIPNDSDQHIPLPSDYLVDFPFPRKSEDATVNKMEESCWIFVLAAN